MARRGKKDQRALGELYTETVVSDLKTPDNAFKDPKEETKEPAPFKDTGPDNSSGVDIESPQEDNFGEKHEKSDEQSINNSGTMSENRSTFDKLYEDVMGDDMLGIGGEDEIGVEDELGAEEEMGGGDPHDLLNQAIDALQQLADVLPGGGEELGDEGLEDELGGLGDEEESFPEGVENVDEMRVHGVPENMGDSGGQGLMKTGGGSNKVAGAVKHSGGSANTGTGIPKEDGVPKELGGHGDRSHPDANNQGAWKVNNPGTPGVGSSMFGN